MSRIREHKYQRSKAGNLKSKLIYWLFVILIIVGVGVAMGLEPAFYVFLIALGLFALWHWLELRDEA